jgi:multidrug efflux system membrane fusion protein
MRNVTRGETGVENVVITEGLEEGERVVTEGGDRLKDGSRVQLPTEAPAGPRGAGRSGQGARGEGTQQQQQGQRQRRQQRPE